MGLPAGRLVVLPADRKTSGRLVNSAESWWTRRPADRRNALSESTTPFVRKCSQLKALCQEADADEGQETGDLTLVGAATCLLASVPDTTWGA